MQSPDPTWKVYSSFINSLFQTSSMLGLDSKKLIERLEIPLATLNDASEVFPLAKAIQLYDEIVSESGNRDVGLYSGRILFVNGLSLQLYMSAISKTFKDYLNLIPSLLKFAGDLGEVKVSREGDLIRLNWVPLWGETRQERFLSDNILANSAAIVNSLCVQPIPVLEAHFTYPKPTDTSLLETLFGKSLKFNQPISCLYYPREVLAYPLSKATEDVNRAVAPQVEHLFKSRDISRDDFLDGLRATIIDLLPVGDIHIEKVAECLSISRRTLQRRLSQRDTQFSQILQDVRSELASVYLKEQRLGVTETAFLLGYSDLSAFSSAFKSWYGVAPSEYR